MTTRLDQLRADMRSQDNHATKNPVFVVQRRERTYGMDSAYSDEYTYLDEEGREIEWSPETGPPKDPLLPDCEAGRVYYKDHWVAVAAFFTEAAAERYIEDNKHDLCDPMRPGSGARVFVESAHRNPEWRMVADHLLKEIPKPNSKTLDAVVLYQAAMTLLALPEIYSDEACVAAAEWIIDAGQEMKDPTACAADRLAQVLVRDLDSDQVSPRIRKHAAEKGWDDVPGEAT